MPNESLPSRRRFTEAARARALEVRRLMAEAPKLPDEGVFVTRCPGDEHRFVWELRRFGGVLIARSPTPFSDPADARLAGEEALSALLGRMSPPGRGPLSG